MKVVLFGATGMVGQGVLRECRLDPDVETVLAVVRTSSLPKHDKLREIVHRDDWCPCGADWRVKSMSNQDQKAIVITGSSSGWVELPPNRSPRRNGGHCLHAKSR